MLLENGLAADGVEATQYSARVLSNPDAMMSLLNQVQHLLQGRESTCHPQFFLASIEREVWIPRVVVVEDADRVVGILYAKERKCAGIPLGIVFADATQGSMIVAEDERREEILEAAIHKLWGTPGIRSLRVLLQPGSSEERVFRRSLASKATSGAIDVQYSTVENHCVLDLPDDYECFLMSLGKQTRRNFRYYRRRAEHAGLRYVNEISLSVFKEVAYRLLAKDVVGSDKSGLTRALGMLSCADRPIMVGLRGEDGEWVSIIGGWYEYDRAVLFCQMNDEKD